MKLLLFVLLASSISAFSHASQTDLNYLVRGIDNAAQKHLILGFLNKIQSFKLSKTTPLHKKAFGNGQTGEVYLKRFKYVQGGIVVRRFFNPLIVASAQYPYIAFNQGHLDQLKNNDDSFSILIHELQHFTNEGLPGNFHALCPKFGLGEKPTEILSYYGEPLEGLDGCDDSPLKSYGVQIVMLNNLGRFCTTCTEDDKKSFLEASNKFLNRIVSRSAYDALVKDMADDNLVIKAVPTG